ncbi:MAG: YdbL family protein [Gammaproteobacteria bacterium]|nr:YdbL family protein [Gammaproteobacteria bacterium]
MRLRLPMPLFPALLLTACVTINIYFPAAAAEKAADRIIEEVWGEKPGKTDAPAKGDEQTRATPRWLDWLVSPAQAAEADLDVSSPAIERLTATMQARHRQLAPHYDAGAIGLTADGLVALRDPGAIPIRERNAVKKLVADENADRNALYREIARLNNHPEWEKEIRETFAKRWVKNAPAGWWYQSGGGWQKKG